MPTPFPGMDPYLERAGLWQQVHTALIVEIQYFLNPLLRPRYYVAIEQLTYLTLLPPPEHRVGIPDAIVTTSSDQATTPGAATATPVTVLKPIIAELPQPKEIKHRYLEIVDTKTQTVITTIEILSPANKIGREGRKQYEQKRFKILGSLTNLVEIDLLRSGRPMPMQVPYQKDYRIVVSRSQWRPQAEVYLFTVRDAIPDFPIPLQPDEEAPTLPLNHLLHDLYDKGGYDMMLDYRRPPVPALSAADAEWAQNLLFGETTAL